MKTMKVNYLFYVVFSFTLLLLGCRNESPVSLSSKQEQELEFLAKLKQSLSNEKGGNEIYQRIKKENERTHFIEKINKRNGEAKFERKIISQTVRMNVAGRDEDSVVYLNIPFGNDNHLTSVLFIKYSSTEFNIKEIDNLDLKNIVYNENLDKDYRERLLMNYLLLDKMQYDTDWYVNIPPTLFPNIIKSDTALTKSFKILEYNISPNHSPIGRDGDYLICLVIADCKTCDDPKTHVECYEADGWYYEEYGDGGDYSGGGETGGNNGNNGGGGDGTGTGNGNPENTDPCSDPNNPWYYHNSCGNEIPQIVKPFALKMVDYGYGIAPYSTFLVENSSIRNGLSSYLNQNNNQQGAGFVFWGLQFLYQNNVSWTQFHNWFIDGTLSSSLMNEFISDLNNPNIVKPTKRFKNHTKINSIYNQAKTAANFKQYLQNFEPTFSVAHLLFDIGATSSTALAHTTPPENFWIKIVFNQNIDWTNTPKIVIADTFMHEIIHAEIFRKLLSLASTNGSIDTALITQYLNNHNYPGLFDYYVKRTVGNENWQHEAMAAHYVNIMVNFLKQIYGNNYTNVEYKTVVWMGLKGTIGWNLLPQSEKDLYTSTWNTNYWLWEL